MLAFILLSTLPFTAALFTAIPSGTVGVYRWMGQIQPELYNGVTLYNPLTSSITLVQYVQDTDLVKNVRCVSKEGVNIDVPSIEIANRIDPGAVISTVSRFGFDYDKVLVVNPLAQRMRELCAERTVDEIEITDFKELDDLLKAEIQKQVDQVNSGIIIDWVRITNVLIPDAIKQKRLELAAEKANRLLAEETSKRVAVEKQTEAFIQKADNERALAATILQAEQIQKLSIANTESMNREATVMAKFYDIPGYAEVLKIQSLSGNTKIYFGDHLPGNMFLGAPPGTVPVSTVPV